MQLGSLEVITLIETIVAMIGMTMATIFLKTAFKHYRYI